MTQKIEAPSGEDIERIAQQLLHAQEVVLEATGSQLSGGMADLALLQRVLDFKFLEPEATYSLQALGIAFGKVFVENNAHYDWWMIEDEYGRDPAIRYKETTLLVFPQTMLSKRIEEGEDVDVEAMYSGLCEQLEEIRLENYRDA
ncbi:MAG TPA: DUF3806 domain-containing protein [Ramlibacter sp.]|nr:DUF3806 domain-containing protein [Ramlibacter sp.]